MTLKRIFAAFIIGLVPVSAAADETWRMQDGQAVYQKDLGNTALISVPYQGSRAMVYIDGLPGALNNRSRHGGYWIGPGQGRCSSILTGPDGYASRNWGRAQIIFDRSTFPSGFTLRTSSCQYDLEYSKRAEAN